MTLKQKDVAKLAKQFDQLSEIVLAIAGTFRSAGGAADDSGDDGEAGDEVRPSAGKSKSAASKPAAKKTAAKGKAAEVTEDDVREALQELAEAKGAGALVAALATVGAGALKDVEEEQYAELLEAAKEMTENDEEYDEPEEKPAKKTASKAAAKTPAKKTAAKAKKPAADQDSATEKFSELVEADQDAAKALLKELGVKKFSLLDDDTDWDEVQGKIEEALEEAGGLV